MSRGTPIGDTSIKVGIDLGRSVADAEKLARTLKGLAGQVDAIGKGGPDRGMPKLSALTRDANRLRHAVTRYHVERVNFPGAAPSRGFYNNPAVLYHPAPFRFGVGRQRPTARGMAPGAADLSGVAALRNEMQNPPPSAVRRWLTSYGGAGGAATRPAARNAEQESRQAGLLARGINTAVHGATVGLGIEATRGALRLADGLGEAVKQSARLAGEFEQSALAFEVMLGSKQKAAALIADTRRLAMDSPLTFKETNKLAQGLLAANIPQGDVVPTVRMLTDISAATGDDLADSLKRVSYAYRQIASAGRLYGTELRQLTEANIPIIDELAKVLGRPVDQVRLLVEAGEVGFGDLRKAFRSMTEEGGRFAGLGAKFGQTFLGRVERVKDAIEQFATEVGQVLIDELGMKEGARDLERYVGRLKDGVGVIRPAVRLIGDLGKGAAQLAAELARGAVVLADSGWATLVAGVPGLERVAGHVRDIAKDLQDWRLDPEKVVQVGKAVGEVGLSVIESGRSALAAFGLQAKADLYDPMAKFLKDMKDGLDSVETVVKRIKQIAGIPYALTPSGLTEGIAGRAGTTIGDALFPLPGPTKDPAMSSIARTLARADAQAADSPLGGSWWSMAERMAQRPAAVSAPTGGPVAAAVDALTAKLAAISKGYADADAARRAANGRADFAERVGVSPSGFIAAVGGAAMFGALSDSAQRAAQGLDRLSEIVEPLTVRQRQMFNEIADPTKRGGAAGQFGRQMADLRAVLNYASGVDDPLLGQTDGLLSQADIGRKAYQLADAARRELQAAGDRRPPAAEFGTREFANIQTSAYGNQMGQGATDVPSLLRMLMQQDQRQSDEGLRALRELPAKLAEVLTPQERP